MASSPALARSRAEHLASLVLTHAKSKAEEYEQTVRYNKQPARYLAPRDAISAVFQGEMRSERPPPSSSSLSHCHEEDETRERLLDLDPLTTELLIKELGRSGSAELALALLDELVSLSDPSSTTAGPSDRQRQQQQRPPGVSKGCYNAALSVCCTQLFGAAASKEALRVYGMMPTADKDVGACNLAIAACSHGGNVLDVISLIDDMADNGILPNDFTVRSALQACMFKRKGDMLEEALEIFSRLSSMSCASRSPAPKQQGGRPSVEIVDALLQICEASMDKARSMEAAESAFQALEGLPPGDLQRCPRAYNAILRACARWGKWQAARRYFDEMKQYKLSVNTESYNNLIKACLKGGALPQALEVFEQMVAGRGVGDSSIHANIETYNSLIKTCHQAGMFEKALEIASWAELSGAQFNEATYEGLLGAADVAEIWDQKAVKQATATSLAVFPHHLRPAHFDAMRLAYLDHLGDLQEEEGLAITKLREKSWAPATLTKGNQSPTPTSPSFGGGVTAMISSPRNGSAARLPCIPGFSQGGASLFPPAFSPAFSQGGASSPLPGQHGASSPLALSRLPSIDINIETAVDKFAEQVAATPELGNSPRKGSDPLPSPSLSLSSPPSATLVGGLSPHPSAAPGVGGGSHSIMDSAIRESLRRTHNPGPSPMGSGLLHLPPLTSPNMMASVGSGVFESARHPSPKPPLQGRGPPSVLMT